MASIQTGIELHDGFTSVIYGIIDAVYSANYAMNDFQATMNESISYSPYESIQTDVEQVSNEIEQAAQEQNNLNRQFQKGADGASDLMDSVKGIVAAYASIQTVEQVIELSDTMTQTNARLDLIVDDGGSVEELQNQIYASAQESRGSYLSTADAISKMGMQAGDAFASNDELIAFTELLNKQFVNAGTSAQGIDSVMLQLTQAMAAGKLQGEELNAVLDNAAPIVQDIQQYLEEVQGIDASNIKDLASEGVITADVIKNAMFYAADEINTKFDSMPMTWGDVWDSFQNDALVAFQPVLQRINDLANNEGVQKFVDNTVNALAFMAGVALGVFDFMAGCASFVADNWSVISPIVWGLVAALAAYGAYLAITKGIELASAAASALHTVAMSAKIGITAALTGSTMAATAAQMGYNGALYACPIAWIIMLIIALIAIIYAVCSAIANMTGIANSGFGVISGGVNVVIQFFKNLGLMVANIALGIGNAIAAVASNIMTAFHNAICSVQSWWYDLLSTVLTVVEGICEALNKLPFVEFDYSGISQAADDYAAKSAEAAGNKEDYTSISDAFNEGMSTFDTFQDGWVSNAFESGAAWGDGVVDNVSGAFDDMLNGVAVDIPNQEDYNAQFSSMNDTLDNIDTSTGDISDSMDITEEDLKYLRDIAEQEAVNRFTTAEVTINQTNNNTINSDMDLDGIISDLTDAVNESVDIMTEGVHM